jgi:Tfp pilus assembly protein PilF
MNRVLRHIAILSLIVFTAVQAVAQPADTLQDRKAVLDQARYLKSVYKTDAAIEQLATLMKPGVMDEEVLAELADCHFQNGDYEKAAGTYQLLSLHSPGNLLYRIKQLQIAFRMKDYLATAGLASDILAQDSIPAVATLAGDAWNLAGQADSALLCYRQALALKPLNEAVVSKAANLLLAAKDYDGVLDMTGEYLAQDPDNFTVAPIQGLGYYLKGEYDSSLAVFQRLENLGADSYPLHFYMGQSYWHVKDPFRAEKELLQAWAIDSTDANLAWAIAAVKSELHWPFEKGVKPWLDKASEMIQPDPAIVQRIHQQYGLGYYRAEQFDKAIPHYKEAYRANPSYIQALSTIGYCYEQLKQYKQALDYYERYIKLAKPGSAGYDYVLKGIEYVKGQLFMEEP